jgi:hypothetical protein
MLEQQMFTSLKGLSEEVFVQRAYLALLGRPADPTGYRDNLARLRAAVPREQVWEDLANSEESRLYRVPPASQQKAAPAAWGGAAAPQAARSVQELLTKDGADFVRAAYWTVLGREADPSGFGYYSQRLSSGDSKEKILADLRRDPEGKAFGARVDGLDALVQQLEAASAAAPAQHVRELFELHGAAFVRAAYLALLRRPADREGLARYTEVLASGKSRSYVLQELAGSPEAKSRNASLPGLQPLLAAYHKAQAPTWGGWYWRTVKGAESDLPAACEVRLLAYARGREA